MRRRAGAVVADRVRPSARTQLPRSLASGSSSGASRRPRRSRATTWSRARTTSSTRATVTLRSDQTTDLRGRQEIKRQLVRRAPDRRHRADQNSRRRQAGGVPVGRCSSAAGSTRRRSPAPSSSSSPQTCWTAEPASATRSRSTRAFPPWRLDRYADARPSAGDRRRSPTAAPPACCRAGAGRALGAVRAPPTARRTPAAPAAAPGMAPEAANVGGSSLPEQRDLRRVTSANGTRHGQVRRLDRRGQRLARLLRRPCPARSSRCPIMGISCDAAAASAARRRPASRRTRPTPIAQLCEAPGSFAPGQLVQPTGGTRTSRSAARSGGAASNWRNRITVPLTFAPLVERLRRRQRTATASTSTAPSCMTQAAAAVGAALLPQPEAVPLQARPDRRARGPQPACGSGTVEAAFGSTVPAGWLRPNRSSTRPSRSPASRSPSPSTTRTGRASPRLRLTPRLLAKLLTSPTRPSTRSSEEYAALAANPLNITLDPEFIALNPGITAGRPGVGERRSRCWRCRATRT